MIVYNTMSRKKEELKTLVPGEVSIYSCGPTVYNFAHIGNLRTYVFMDELRRTLKRAGYNLKHCMNITDVGHLTSDADEGEDKMAKASREQKKDPMEIAAFYTEILAHFVEYCLRSSNVACRSKTYSNRILTLGVKCELRIEGYYTVDLFK